MISPAAKIRMREKYDAFAIRQQIAASTSQTAAIG
jgi:hypothetical protein